MKYLAKLPLACGVFLTFFYLVSCSFIVPSGIMVQKTYSNTDFDTIEIHDAFNATITQGESFAVSLIIDQNLVDYVTVTQTGSNLTIAMRPSINFTGGFNALRAEITLPSIRALDLDDASSGTVRGFDTKGGNLTLSCSSASSLTYMGSALDYLSISAHAASTITLSDFSANTATVNVDGASKVRGTAGTTVIESLALSVKGASSLEMDVSDSITGSVEGASTVRYGLNPSIVGLYKNDITCSIVRR